MKILSQQILEWPATGSQQPLVSLT
jgi:hypothetical protein